jgi:hypothetical protein
MQRGPDEKVERAALTVRGRRWTVARHETPRGSGVAGHYVSLPDLIRTLADLTGRRLPFAAVVSPRRTTSTRVFSGARVSSGESKSSSCTPATSNLLS